MASFIFHELEVGDKRKKLIEQGDIIRHRQWGDREYVFMYATEEESGQINAIACGPKNRARGAHAQYTTIPVEYVVVPRKKKED